MVLLGLVSFAVAILLSLLGRRIHTLGKSLGPELRIRWYFAALSAPILIGSAVVILALGHCVGHHLLGTAEDCHSGTESGCGFCLFTPGPVTALTATLAIALSLVVLSRVASVVIGVVRARRAARRLLAIATRREDGVWTVPGADAFVLGWPTSVIVVGEQLIERLTPAALRAVTAHEQGHKLRGDLLMRMVAKALSVTHLRPLADELLDALDLAIEQACDAHAIHSVQDPLIVADALIHTAKLQTTIGHPALSAGSSNRALTARIEALCLHPSEPATDTTSARPDATLYVPAPWPAWLRKSAVVVAVSLVLLSHHIHHAAEHAYHWLNR
jgi:Zn-dependent protease with chaperone function